MRVAFVGAGRVNFGWSGDPWDHATRLENINPLIPLQVVGIFDKNTELAHQVLKQRLEGTNRSETQRSIWKDAKIFSSLEAMIKEAKPEAVWIGVPPAAHGEIEKLCVSAGIHMFIEKPISCGTPETVEQIHKMLHSNPKVVVSVGYMLRYSKAVDYIKDFLSSRHLMPTSIMARYNTAYPSIGSKMWWDQRTSGGPIIEQATHFCDLLRYFGGEYDPKTVQAISVMSNEPVGLLSNVPEGTSPFL
uniref:Gfo/Idh/MocA-like oxidoreductase N-terminal domain-containing protein n=1 Tax=Arcella intermedia TaxID=1963864 RepID=A0A6B2LFC6_9EUKA